MFCINVINVKLPINIFKGWFCKHNTTACCNSQATELETTKSK